MKSLKRHFYSWQGISHQGNKIKGQQDAVHPELLRLALQRKGFSKIKISRKNLLFDVFHNINHQDIIIFSRQMAMLLKAGIALAQALAIIGDGSKKIKMKHLMFNIKNSVEQGDALAGTLKKFPQYFNALYCSLISVGESSGSLDVMFMRVTLHKERIESLKKKAKKALFYPMTVIVVAVIVTVTLLVFVVPQFEILFHSFGAQLPLPTRVVINVSLCIQNHAGLIFLFFAFLSVGIVASYRYSRRFVSFVDQMVLRLPLVGGILRKAIIARFVQTFSVTYTAGLPLADGLYIVANVAGNNIYRQAIQQVRKEILGGQTLRYALNQSNLFPEILLQMVAVGEESGTLEAMLVKLSDIFEEEVNSRVDNLSNLLEPSIMILLGLVIGGLLVALYLPIFKLGSVI